MSENKKQNKENITKFVIFMLVILGIAFVTLNNTPKTPKTVTYEEVITQKKLKEIEVQELELKAQKIQIASGVVEYVQKEQNQETLETLPGGNALADEKPAVEAQKEPENDLKKN